jgi:NADPH:quinone reductase-like Zn-dependent oxidoreductase
MGGRIQLDRSPDEFGVARRRKHRDARTGDGCDVKAVIYYESGGSDVLRYQDVADPEPGPADVIVRVAACAVNRLDVIQRCGWFQLAGFRYPHIAGMDIAGEIVALGDAVAGHHVGERVVIDPNLAAVSARSKLAERRWMPGELGVIGANEHGGYAELVLIPESQLHRVPDEMPFAHAAAFPTCFMTAGHALLDVGTLQRGETILIHAAGSGLSTAAIEIAKHEGAIILATAGTNEKCARATQIGAHHVLNNRSGDVAVWAREVTDGRGVDIVFDHVGAALFAQSIDSLAIGGRLITCGNTSGGAATIPSLAKLFHRRLTIQGAGVYQPGAFRRLWAWFCAEAIGVVIDSEFALGDAGAAQERMLRADHFGKILLVP